MFFLIGITLSAFLCALLLLKKNKSNADRILTIWMAVMAVHQILFYLSFTGIAYSFPHLLGIVFPWPLLHGPFLFLYVLAMTREKPLRWKEIIPHFIPFLLLYLLAIPFFILPAANKIDVFNNNGADYGWYNLIQQGMIIFFGIGYIIWSLIRIHRHRSKIKQWFSNTDRLTLRWLEYLAIGLGAIWFLVLFFDDVVIFSGVTVLVIFIGMFGITQLPVFYTHRETAETLKQIDPASFDEFIVPDIIQENDVIRYAKSGLKSDEATELHKRLTHLMEEKELYKRNDVTLADLAGLLDTHPNYLSQVINEREQKNFYNYINTLRVQAFIDTASDPVKKHYSYLALAFDCGFNSKSTFNKYFKEFSGKTPSEYFSK